MIPSFTRRAACQDKDTSLFEATRWEDGAVYALNICVRCPVIAECLDFVQPRRARFSGVAGNRVWSCGSDITDATRERFNGTAPRRKAGERPRSDPHVNTALVERLIRTGEGAELLTLEERIVAAYALRRRGWSGREIAAYLGCAIRAANHYVTLTHRVDAEFVAWADREVAA